MKQSFSSKAVALLFIVSAHFFVLWLITVTSISPAQILYAAPTPTVMVETLPAEQPAKPEHAPQPPSEPKPMPKRETPKPRPPQETPKTTTSETAITAPGPEPELAAVSHPPPAAQPAPAAALAEPAPAPIIPPRFHAAYLNNPAPVYPPLLRRTGQEGKVVLRVLVTAEGNAGEVQVFRSSGSDLFDQAALSAVGKWRFVPARRGDAAIAQWVQVPIDFKLN